jgi:hypothetical protein
VRLRHDEAVIAGLRDSATAQGAAMNRHELADPIASANFSFRGFARKLQILRRQTNRNEGEDVRFIANPSAAVNDTVAVEVHPLAQYDFIANYGIRTDPAARPDLGIWTNDRGGMDLHRGFLARVALNGRSTHS